MSAINEQLADNTNYLALKTNQVDYLREVSKLNYLRYGILSYPSEFTQPDVQIYRDVDGKIYHNFDFEKYRVGEKTIYFGEGGYDTTGDGTLALPYKSLIKSIEMASSAVESKVVIKALTQNVAFQGFSRDAGRTIIVSGKTISIISDSANTSNKIRCINGKNSLGLTWVADSGIFKSARSACNNVIDFKRVDVYGVPIPYDRKFTLAECIANPYTWYTDAVTIWVHNVDATSPDTDIWALLQSAGFWMDISDSTMFCENVEFYNGGVSSGSCDITGNQASVFINKDCLFTGGKVDDSAVTTGNGLSIEGVGKTYSFNSKAAYCAKDGFNYHYSTIPTGDRRSCIAFEYQCKGYRNGVGKTLKNNNATTAHESCTVYRVSCVGWETNGPILADIQGCNVYCVDCHMRKSLINDLAQSLSTGFFFDNTVGAVSNGVAYLENCSSGGENTYAISSDNLFDFKLLGFKGTKILNSTWEKVALITDIV